MPFRDRFECLWCGGSWQTRAADDLEGWALLCPDCLGRADDNGFLRMRLRTALRERSAAAAAGTAGMAGPPLSPPAEGLGVDAGAAEGPGVDAAAAEASRVAAATATHPGDWEDWYLRRGAFSRGPVHDGAWSMELEAATRWLDGLAIGGTIVELGAGMGWWSGLLADKGELWLYDPHDASLEAARGRLMAHGLLAHLHQRDLLAVPDKAADVLFAAYLLGAAADERALARRLAVVRGWLKPGGLFAFVEAQAGDAAPPIPGPAGPLRARSSETLAAALRAAGFDAPELCVTGSAFVLGSARVPGRAAPQPAAGRP